MRAGGEACSAPCSARLMPLAWAGLLPSAISLRLRSDFALRIPCLSPLCLPQPHRFCISEALAPYLIVHFRSARASLPPLISPSALQKAPVKPCPSLNGPLRASHRPPPVPRIPVMFGPHGGAA